MSIAATPVDAGRWGEDDREAVVASYAEAIGRLAADLSAGPHDVPVEPAIEYAHRILAAAVREALAEARARARVAHGLPEHDESHRGVASELAEEVLLRHGGGEIDDQSLQDLLVDLIHWAGADGFDAALEGALERYEEEVEEDAGTADDAAAAEATATATLTVEERRVREAQIARLHAHRPQRYDA